MAPGDEINIKVVLDFLWVVPNDVTAEGFLGSFETEEDRDLDERILELAAIEEEKELKELEALVKLKEALSPKENCPVRELVDKSDTTNVQVAPKPLPRIDFPRRYNVEHLEYLKGYTVLASLNQETFDKLVQDESLYLPDLYRTATRYVDQQQDIAKEGTVDAVELGYFVYYRKHHDLLLDGSKEEAALQGTLSFLKKILQAENEYSAAKLDKIDQLFTDIGSLNEEFDAEINAPANIIYHDYLTFKRCFPFAAVGFEGARSRFSVNAENGCDGVTKFQSQGILPFRKPSVEKFRKYLLDFTKLELLKYNHQGSSMDRTSISSNISEFNSLLITTSNELILNSSEHLMVLEKWLVAIVEGSVDQAKPNSNNYDPAVIREIVESEISVNDPGQKWKFFFYDESEFQYFLKVLTSFFSDAVFDLNAVREIVLKRKTKTRFAPVLYGIYHDKYLKKKSLKKDELFLEFVRKINEFADRNTAQVYDDITRRKQK